MVVMEETTGVESPSVHVLPSSLKNATAISPPYNFPTSFTLPYSAFLSRLSLEMGLSILLSIANSSTLHPHLSSTGSTSTCLHSGLPFHALY